MHGAKKVCNRAKKGCNNMFDVDAINIWNLLRSCDFVRLRRDKNKYIEDGVTLCYSSNANYL